MRDSAAPARAILAARLSDGEAAVGHVLAAQAALPGPRSNLFEGTAGTLAAALIVRSTVEDPRLERIVAPGVAWLARQARAAVEFDAIAGLAGLGRLLLLARDLGYERAGPGLEAALRALTGRLGPGIARPGMAHGLAGPVALLAIALDAGVAVPGQGEALHAAAARLAAWPAEPRHQWCVGTAGIARAVQLAGNALADPALTRAGTDSLSAIAATPPERWGVRDAMLCCGYAGVLRTALSAGLPALADAAAAAIHDTWRPGDASLLYGDAGVALALHDHANPGPVTWPALLLVQ
ncbi:lanthionine synthetase LanC family protein [Dactylosporangium sp. NPDC005572]|uniref:lanthionine synthetase LanC family protein n=1 Tax=Dactylosporangium sp. NPDC005572 TaxID=3156889 RepID=UPI0033AC075F